MDEFLGAILLGIAELLCEALMETAFGALAGLFARAFRRFRVTVRRSNPIVATVVFTLTGVAFGFVGVWIFPHPLVHPSRVHGISLLITPVVTGLVMDSIGRAWRRRGRTAVRIESFGYGYTFALAMAVVRFWLVR
jgi:hypothetical protein